MGSSSPSRLHVPKYKKIKKRNKLGEEKELIEIDKEIFDFRLKNSKLLKDEKIESYESKIQQLSKIESENVIKYDGRTFEEKDKLYILTEYAENYYYDLKKFIEDKKDKLDNEEIIKQIIIQICLGNT